MSSAEQYGSLAAFPDKSAPLPRLNLDAIKPLKDSSRQAIMNLVRYKRKRDNFPILRRAAVVSLPALSYI